MSFDRKPLKSKPFQSNCTRSLNAVGLSVAIAALAAGAPDGARAVTLFQKSAFTAIDLKSCELIKQHGDGNAYLCPGLPGIPVYLAEADGRTFVSAGTAAERTRAASQSLTAFNTPFLPEHLRATIEWRFVVRDGRKVPYAMIVRYFTHDETSKGDVLVVTRLAASEACHIAYIDARANRDAIVLARAIADERARSFDCTNQARVVGETGMSPM